jgi:hypothetical protein
MWINNVNGKINNRCTKIPTRVQWPPGEFFLTCCRTFSCHLDSPWHSASLSIHHPMTCSLRFPNRVGLRAFASLMIAQGDQGFLALAAARSTLDQMSGMNQLVCCASSGCLVNLRPTGLLFLRILSLNCRWGRKSSATVVWAKVVSLAGMGSWVSTKGTMEETCEPSRQNHQDISSAKQIPIGTLDSLLSFHRGYPFPLQSLSPSPLWDVGLRNILTLGED